MSYPARYLQLEVSEQLLLRLRAKTESSGREEVLVPDIEDRGVFLISTG